MALLFLDGFDHLGIGDPVTLGKWATGSGTTLTTQVRTGSHSCRLTQTGTMITKPLAVSGGAVIGLAFFGVTNFVAVNLLELREDTTVHVALGITAGGLLVIKRGTTTLATGTTVLPFNSWLYIELLATIHDTTGSYEVRIDGVTEAALTASGADTRNAGTTGQWNRLLVGSTGGSGGLCYIDDLYVGDTSGAAPWNTFLGAVKVETIYPQTDAVAVGSNAGLTPSTGTDHGALVDETTPNTSDYNSHATVGQKDTYQYPSLSLTGTVLGIQTNLYVAKSDAAARQVCAVVRAGGVDYDGANVSPTTTFGYFSEVRALNPNTGIAWTTADLVTLQAGMKVTA